MSRTFLIVLSFSLLAGCGHMRPKLEKSDLVGLPAVDLATFITAADGTAKNFKRRFAKQEEREWDTGAANLIGGTVGAIGAVAHSIPAAGIGAVTVGAAEMVANFYGVEKQNDAYTKAYAATKCISVLASNINKPASLGNFLSPDGEIPAETYALAELNKAMSSVEDKLVERLRKRAVSTSPDFSAFEVYLKARVDAGRAPKSESFVAAAADDQMQVAIGRLEADIGICLTTF